MIVISEAVARQLLNMSDAIDAMTEMFRAIDSKRALAFPLVREQIEERSAIFSVKSGACSSGNILGLKTGGYWTENTIRGLSNHQSATVLLNPKTGQPLALVSSNYLTAMRTAAVAGLATDLLSRANSSVMGIVGAGAQAVFQIEAILAVRPIKKLIIASRTVESARRLGERAKLLGIQDITIGSVADAVKAADVLTTITPAKQAFVDLEAVKAGAHINAMGSDTAGKQELDPSLLHVARVFVDDWTQASNVGECQHAVTEWGMREQDLAGNVGSLVAESVKGRVKVDDITVFDSTGLALQDLSVARLVVDRASRHGLGNEVELCSPDQ